MAGKTRISFTQGCIAPSLFEFGTVVIEKKIPAILERGKKMWKFTTATTEKYQMIGSGELIWHVNLLMC